MKYSNTALVLVHLAIAFPLVLLTPGIPLRGEIKPASTNESIVERGKLRFYEFKQPRGEESYEIAKDGDRLVVTSRVELQMEEKISLSATLKLDRELTPAGFEIKGKKPSGSEVDAAVQIHGQTATVREGKETSQTTLPERFFTVADYVPLAVEMMLVRYVVSHRISGPLKTLPHGDVTIDHRGHDAVTIDGKPATLERYSLGGLTWGHQTLWLDDAGKLTAVVGIGGDLETTLPAIREGFESNIGFFLKRAAEDLVQRFNEMVIESGARKSGLLAIVGGTLIDGTGSAPVADSVVLIEGDRIISAGSRSRVKIPRNARVVEVRGKFILPGLWDMHAHLFQAEFGPAYLSVGVTTVREMGDEMEFISALRDAFNSGQGVGPRMLRAGYIDGKTKEHGFDVEVDTPDEARAAVRRYKDAGFEQIKIRDHLKLEILKVIADEAHRLGMTLTGHVPSAINVLQAVEAGQDQISHINFVAPVFDFKRDPAGKGFVVDLETPKSKRALELFKQHGTAFDPTLAYMEMYLRTRGTLITSFEPGFARLPSNYAEHLSNAAFAQGESRSLNGIGGFLAVVGALRRAGVPVYAGTDAVVPGYSVHRELELFVEAGLTPMEAIQAATIVPARMMRLDKETGSIEKGKRADLIIVDANPLESIGNIRKVRQVVARGRIFDCARLRLIAGFQP